MSLNHRHFDESPALSNSPYSLVFAILISGRRQSMNRLSDEQLNSLSRETLIIIVTSLQSQLEAVQGQLDVANSQLAENNKQIELLAEQIRLMNQR